jgi:hypothetical protein
MVKNICERLFMVGSVYYGWYLAANYDGDFFVYGLALWLIVFIVFEFILKKINQQP